MPNQSTTIVDVVLVVLSIGALALIGLAMLWRRWRARSAALRLAAQPAALQLPLSPEQEQWVRTRIAELERQQAEAQAAPPPPPDWIGGLVGALHLLVIGHSRGGKTTLIHELAQRRLTRGERIVVCDLDAARGQWPGCEVHGYANDIAAVRRALQGVGAEWERRNIQRAAGVRAFDPLTLIVDEYADVADDARDLVERILRRGGKLAIQLIIGVQDKQVKTMGFEGQGDLRKNFSFVVEVRRDAAGQRAATLQESGEGSATTYAVPPLTDPESLIVPPDTADADRLLSNLLAELNRVPVRPALPDPPAKTAPVSGTGTASNGGTPHLSAVPPEDTEIEESEGVPARLSDEAIEILYKAWRSKNRIAAMLSGSKGKRLAQIDAALERMALKAAEPQA